jgi:hypothetical protein
MSQVVVHGITAHPVAQPSEPAGDVFREIGVGEAGSESVQVILPPRIEQHSQFEPGVSHRLQ